MSIYDVPYRWAMLITPHERLPLRQQKHTYWWRMRRCRGLGYLGRPKSSRGSWYAKVVLNDGLDFIRKIGEADDDKKADGISILNFDQAVARAEEFFVQHIEDAAPDRSMHEYDEVYPEVPPAPPYTVGNAAKDYMEWYKVHRRGIYSVYGQLRRHVVEKLGNIPLESLRPAIIEEWQKSLIKTPPIVGYSRFTGRVYGTSPVDPEGLRKRKNSANRYLTFFKALLNRAYKHGHVKSDWAWRNIRPYKNVMHTNDVRYLTQEEVVAILKASREDARKFFSGGLLTGCRIGDLIGMRVSDFHPKVKRISLVAGKNQRRYHIPLSKEGFQFFEEHTRGRDKKDWMFIREGNVQWSYYQVRTRFLEAVNQAEIYPKPTPHSLRHTYATRAVMAGIPLRVVAELLGHSNMTMVEIFYLHLTPDYVDREVEDRMPDILQ
ncbi:MAG: tyrosine-type recombinase/integrase [Rhodospirillales bacterium]